MKAYQYDWQRNHESCVVMEILQKSQTSTENGDAENQPDI